MLQKQRCECIRHFYSSQQARYYELCKNEHQFFKAIDVTPLYGENKVLTLNETRSWSKLM